MKNTFRRVLALLFAVAMLIGTIGCSSKAPSETETPEEPVVSKEVATEPAEDVHLEIMCWAGSNQEVVPTAVCEAYDEAADNVTINVTSGQNATLYPQMVAARQNTPESPLFNMAYMNGFSTVQGTTDDLWVAPNLDNIPNVQNILEAYRPEQGDLGITWALSPMTIFYNPEKVSTPPTSWADLWNEEYKGHVAVWDNLFYSFLVPTARVLGGDENDMDAAFELWAEHTDQFYSIFTSVDQLKNLFISEDVWIAPFFVGMALSWEEEGIPVKAAVLDEGCVAFPYILQTCAGSSDAQLAECEKIINELLDKKNIEEYIVVSPVVPVMDGIELPDYLKDNYFFSTECTENAMILDWNVCAGNDAAWRERWETEIKSQF